MTHFSSYRRGLCLAVIMAAAVLAPAVKGDCTTCSLQNLKLPTGPVGVQLDYGPYVGQSDIYFRATISGMPLGYSVFNGTYHAWCADAYVYQLVGTNPVHLYSTYGNSMPAGDQNANWDKVNWLLNHKKGSAMVDIQAAMWLLLGEPVPFSHSYNVAAANALYAAALANGTGFVPGEGQSLAILVSVGGIQNPSIDPTNKNQTTILELECPLTQGYWKNHVNAWPLTTINLGFATYNTGNSANVQTLLNIFNTPVRGNSNISLEHQLIAAELNVAAGVNPGPVQSAINAAISALLASGGNNVPSGSPAGQLMDSIEGTLDSFNSGTLAGVCATGGS
jgi:hypothetical protein